MTINQEIASLKGRITDCNSEIREARERGSEDDVRYWDDSRAEYIRDLRDAEAWKRDMCTPTGYAA